MQEADEEFAPLPRQVRNRSARLIAVVLAWSTRGNFASRRLPGDAKTEDTHRVGSLTFVPALQQAGLFRHLKSEQALSFGTWRLAPLPRKTTEIQDVFVDDQPDPYGTLTKRTAGKIEVFPQPETCRSRGEIGS